MRQSAKSLFRFSNPPVVETVLGIQFDSLPNVRNAHLGVFWRRLGSNWPKVVDAPPLPQNFEQFGVSSAWAESGLQLRISQDPAFRLQIYNSTGDRMIQLQNGRFLYNWLGHDGADYPTYTKVRPEFDSHLRDLMEFLSEESLGDLLPNQWEVTYVNHIPKGTIWNDPVDWAHVFPSLVVLPSAPPARFESLNGQWHFEIEKELGRLHVQLSHAKRAADQGELLIATLTARGPINEELDLDAGLNIGRETIVRTFKRVDLPVCSRLLETR